ncbi:MAG: 2-oxo acid dehydrogenase subunit E2 [Candidatus Aenigmarchaeota archaeon]|nr:2-oxo acid dehydrogenase subunit E2 [Candidatus Aenigmarchaeota archaeon]
MPFDFKFPDVGEGIAEGELVKWLVKEGEPVKQDQPLAEVETDKAVVEIPSPKSGIIGKLYFKAGDTVKVGQILVTIFEEGEKAAPAAEIKKPEIIAESRIKQKEEIKSEAPKKDAGAVVGVLEEAPEEIRPSGKLPEVIEQKAAKPLAMPSVRKIAEKLAIDLKRVVAATGAHGQITKSDVEKAAAQKEPEQQTIGLKVTKKYDMYGYLERVPLKGIRKSVALNMVKSKFTIPHVTHTEEADVTHLVEIRESLKELAREHGIHLTYLPFIIKAIIEGLKKYPYMNSTLDEQESEIILKKYYNIGLAVDVEGGLIVPVIKIADSKSIFELAKEIEIMANKAKERKLDLQDMKGGTFTITNVGSIGGIFATPIINYPEAAILAPGRIHERPVVKDSSIVIRKIMPLSLSFDHRIVDGAYAARFTNEIKTYLENPHLFLLEEK